jgi:hypothetical protein
MKSTRATRGRTLTNNKNQKDHEEEEGTSPKDFVDTTYLSFPQEKQSRPWTSNLLDLLK